MNQNLKIFTFLLTLVFFFSSTVAPTLAAVTYTYDQNGNMTSDGSDCFEYNEANQLKKVKNCSTNQTIAEYVYDYNGNRVIKKIYSNGTLQKTVYSPSDEFETVKLASNAATQNTSYYFANGQLIAKKDPSGNKTYFHNDHLGSTSVVSNQAGQLVESTAYDPWGEVKSGGTASKFLYTGQEKDNETNLHYYNARYYDPHIRRFTQPDSIVEDVYDPQMLNRYTYVRNNPLKYTDPTGHFKVADTIIKALSNPAAAWQSLTRTVSTFITNAKNFFTKPAAKEVITKAEQAAPSRGSKGSTSFTPPSSQIQQISQSSSSSQIPKVTDPRLQNYVDAFYKGVTNPHRIGSGTTADAIRYETKTGLEVFGSKHTQKGEDLLRGIDKWLKNHPNAPKGDINAAKSMKDDILDALQEVNKGR